MTAESASTKSFESSGRRFEWDTKKNDANNAKHGLSFENAARAFSGPLLTRRDDRRDYGEERWIALGKIDGLVIVVVYTLRRQNVRIISARKANSDEKKAYQEEIEEHRRR